MKKKKLNALEYSAYPDAALIRKSLRRSNVAQTAKIVVFALLLLGVEALSFIFKNNIAIPNLSISPDSYLIAVTAMLGLALICNIDAYFPKDGSFKHALGNNLVALFSSAAVVSRTAYIYFFQKELIQANDLFIGILLVYLIFNSFTEILINKRILKNLRFVSSKNEKYAAEIRQKYDIPDSILTHIETKNPVIATKTGAENLTNFTKNSRALEPSKKIFSIISIILSLVALAASAASFLLHKNLAHALAVLCAALLIGCPTPMALSLNISLNSACKKALKKGILITNQATIRDFSAVNAAIIDASSLYPSKNVILKEIKTFHGQRIDEAILYAATLVSTRDSTLSKVFDRIIMGQKKILKKVSDVTYEDQLGISGWVNGKKIIVGNREILKKNKISPPSRDYEAKHTTRSDGLIYIAIDKDLVAMFILEYRPHKALKADILRAIKVGTEVLIRTADTNITRERIELDFGVPCDLIKIIPYEKNFDINENLPPQSSAEANLAVSAGNELLLKATTLCKSTAMNFKLIQAIQIIALAISSAISVVLGLCGFASPISELEIFTYMAFWSLASIICSKFN